MAIIDHDRDHDQAERVTGHVRNSITSRPDSTRTDRATSSDWVSCTSNIQSSRRSLNHSKCDQTNWFPGLAMSTCTMRGLHAPSCRAILTRSQPSGLKFFDRHAHGRRVSDVHNARSARDSQPTSAPPLFWKTHISRRMNLPYALETCVKQILREQSHATDKGTGSPEALVDNSSTSDSVKTEPASHAYGVQPTLAIVFVSSAYADSYAQLVPLLREQVPSLTTIVGCSVSKTPRLQDALSSCRMVRPRSSFHMMLTPA